MKNKVTQFKLQLKRDWNLIFKYRFIQLIMCGKPTDLCLK